MKADWSHEKEGVNLLQKMGFGVVLVATRGRWEVGQKSFAKRLELVALTTTTPLDKEVAGMKDCGR